jgi:hypothetical protein
VLEAELDDDLVHALELVLPAHLGGQSQECRVS